MLNMLRKSFLLLSIFLFICPNLLFARSGGSGTKDGCLKAVRRAIEMELKDYEQRLKTAEKGVGPAGNAEKFKNRIKDLKCQLIKITGVKPEDYRLSSPEVNQQDMEFGHLGNYGPVMPAQEKKVIIQADQKCKNGLVFNVEGMTHSEPFYHVAGIVNDDYSRIKLNHRYELTIYLVYKREYFGFIPDYYAYIAKVRNLGDTAKGKEK